MGIFGALAVIVLVVGIVGYLFCTGISKTSMAEVFRIAFAMGLLAWLMSAGAQSCSMSTQSGGGGTAQHR
jgi:hypothetical protein